MLISPVPSIVIKSSSASSIHEKNLQHEPLRTIYLHEVVVFPLHFQSFLTFLSSQPTILFWHNDKLRPHVGQNIVTSLWKFPYNIQHISHHIIAGNHAKESVIIIDHGDGMEPIPGHLGGHISHPRTLLHRLRVDRHHVGHLPSTDLAGRCRVRFDIVRSLGRVDGDDGTFECLSLEEIVRRNDAHQLGVLIEHRCGLHLVR
mmetsp:Transcript_25740/g.74462  ORF Transcript_25740/g.74462 Transcript_25740/m.74462 type:complete len:202 (-) Transcript_25740:414-1019(-)